METDNLQNIWKINENRINLKTINELNRSLEVRSRQALKRFLAFFIIDITVCIGLIIFLIITGLHHQYDIIYLANNTILTLITLTSLIISLISYNKLQNNNYNLSLKEWAGQKIKLLTVWFFGRYSKLYVILIPILVIMINISIHVYYEYKTLAEVLKNGESVTGLVTGSVLGIIISFYALNKIRKYQIKNLGYLKEIHAMLSEETE